MIRAGVNLIDGIPVTVVRKRIRRINIRVAADGGVMLSVPERRATLAEGEAFLRSKWHWVTKTRTQILLKPRTLHPPLTEEQKTAFSALLTELHAVWTAKLDEADVTWRTRRMKTRWGTCHIRKRHITYSTELAFVPREMVEYIVVHELTHLRTPGHGQLFYALMDARLPGWRILRRRLNSREFGT